MAYQEWLQRGFLQERDPADELVIPPEAVPPEQMPMPNQDGQDWNAASVERFSIPQQQPRPASPQSGTLPSGGAWWRPQPPQEDPLALPNEEALVQSHGQVVIRELTHEERSRMQQLQNGASSIQTELMNGNIDQGQAANLMGMINAQLQPMRIRQSELPIYRARFLAQVQMAEEARNATLFRRRMEYINQNPQQRIIPVTLANGMEASATTDMNGNVSIIPGSVQQQPRPQPGINVGQLTSQVHARLDEARRREQAANARLEADGLPVPASTLPQTPEEVSQYVAEHIRLAREMETRFGAAAADNWMEGGVESGAFGNAGVTPRPTAAQQAQGTVNAGITNAIQSTLNSFSPGFGDRAMQPAIQMPTSLPPITPVPPERMGTGAAAGDLPAHHRQFLTGLQGLNTTLSQHPRVTASERLHFNRVYRQTEFLYRQYLRNGRLTAEEQAEFVAGVQELEEAARRPRQQPAPPPVGQAATPVSAHVFGR